MGIFRFGVRSLLSLGSIVLLSTGCGSSQNRSTTHGAAPLSQGAKPLSFDAFVALERVGAIEHTVALPGETASTPNPPVNPLANSFNNIVEKIADCDENCQHLRQEFRYVVFVGKEIYCYWPEKQNEAQIDFEALAHTLESSITTNTSYNDYYLILRRWAASFHDGHVNVMAQSDMTGLEIYTAPIRVEVLAPATDHEKVIVAGIVAGQSAPGVFMGDQILAMNGVPVGQALTEAAKNSSGSTERMRRFSAGRKLVDVMGLEAGSRPFVLTLKSVGSDAERSVELFRTIEIDAKPATAPGRDAGNNSDAGDPSGADLISARILPNGLGYLRLDGFSGSQDDFLISQTMNRLAQTRGLIIDLRKNGGGDLSGDRIIERLATQAVTRYKRSERLSPYVMSQRPDIFNLMADATGLFAEWHDLTVTPDSQHHYGKPVIAMTSPYCFSACDTFSSALKTNGLAKIFGESTGGGTGTPLVFELPLSPLKFRYSVIRGQTSQGTALEGTGTEPDVYLEPTLTDRARQKDVQLEEAVKLLGTLAGTAQVATPDLSAVPSVAQPRTDTSPTREENQMLLRLQSHDEL